ncbi:Uncharacterised protein [Mycobacterium tuberculosis]|nr:Uncharacterised protein [Mycobacterium tuberculosis]
MDAQRGSSASPGDDVADGRPVLEPGAEPVRGPHTPPVRLLRWWNYAAALTVAAAVLLLGPWPLWFRILVAVGAVVVPMLWEQVVLRGAARRREQRRPDDRG